MLVNKTKRIFSVLLATFIVMCLSISVFGDTMINIGLEGDMTESGVLTAMKEATDDMGVDTDSYSDGLYIKIKGTPTQIMEVEGTQLSINKTQWSKANKKDVNKAMRAFIDHLDTQGFSDDAMQSFMSNVQSSDNSVSSVMLPLIFEKTQGDMYQAYKITSPFLDILSVVLGVGAVILILLLLFSTVMDLAYIGLPVWREAQAGKDGGKKNPFGVSYEAILTVEEVEKGIGGGDAGYKNAYLLYFKRRALTYIILAICIMYLICGGLSGIISFVLTLVSGITG